MKEKTNYMRRCVSFLRDYFNQKREDHDLSSYIRGGRVPWSRGYDLFKWQQIKLMLYSESVLNNFRSGEVDNFGVGLDERIVEYAWAFSNLKQGLGVILDAGSTLNFKTTVEHPLIANKDLFISTYFPERNNFFYNRINYNYCDLRNLPFRNEIFDTIICLSTIEHIGMDNSLYGYKSRHTSIEKSYEYMLSIEESFRVLKNNGELLLTFPIGKYENHGFFQQFDNEMISRILNFLGNRGEAIVNTYRYYPNGWKMVSMVSCLDANSYNPHTGIGKGTDGAAHCRAICCIKFIKK